MKLFGIGLSLAFAALIVNNCSLRMQLAASEKREQGYKAIAEQWKAQEAKTFSILRQIAEEAAGKR